MRRRPVPGETAAPRVQKLLRLGGAEYLRPAARERGLPGGVAIRIRAVLEYDGTAYRGWQRQPDAPSVQAACEAALSRVLGVETGIVAAGRTDRGVHARGQVVHFEHAGRLSARELRRAWNAGLPADVWVRRLEQAEPAFHARFDATARTYRYFVAHGPRALSPFVRRYAWPLRRPPDWDRVREATERIVGRHDFRRFAKGDPAGGGHTLCEVRSARWARSSHGRALEITADRFLRHMVRALVGTVVAVGRGRIPLEAVEGALQPGGDRARAGYAPPEGLFLWHVDYSNEDGARGYENAP
ncbi:MAG TPA: tRNA pseudouridine(38-40) synthase TruA [Gemmatimonadota bacterium]|nr:tRNA pseudouridine(38-40) synthase TruA [Gemmatimonadota bacterium]